MNFGPEDEQDDDTLELTADLQIDGEVEGEAEQPVADDFPDTFDDEPSEDAEPGTPLIKHFRQRDREHARRIKELEAEVSRYKPTPQRTKKPDLWDDCDGDPDKFEESLLAWKDNEAAVVNAEKQQTEQATNHAKAWADERTAYQQASAALGKQDYGEAEDAVCAVLTEASQAAIVMAASNPQAAAKIIYALGRSPAKLAELVKIQDNPLKLAAAIGRLEAGKGSAMQRKEPPAIDTPLRGSAPLSQAVDREEARLAKDAEQTKNYTKLFEYRRNKRKAA